MSGWTAEAVLAAAAAWTWVPPDASQVLTEDYQVVAYPGHYQTFPVQVLWSRSDRPVDELIGEVAAHARGWGHDEVQWSVSAETRPAGTERELARRGATAAETLEVLAYDMSGGLPVLDEPAAVDWRIVRDEATVRASRQVNLEVWGGGGEPGQAGIDRALAEARDGLASWSSFSVVAFLDGRPAGYGGCSLDGRIARLWGGGTAGAFRGRGAYRVVLGRRLALAREHGATLALVKGRVDTSAPILRRAGFRWYGEERRYHLRLGRP